MKRSLGIILKISERCNLACSYCYFFFSGDDSYQRHSPTIKKATIDDVGDFIAREVLDNDLSVVQIDLHGGEPLLMKKRAFREMATTLVESCGPAECRLALQTNGTLLDEEWLDIFGVFNVCFSFSLDGPKAINDAARVDKKGLGSYDDVAEAISRAHRAFEAGRLEIRPGVLCVINPIYDGAEIYRHLVHDLGFDRLDFLLPDENYNSMKAPSEGQVGRYLTAVFEAWVADDDPSVKIRFVELYLGRILSSPQKRKAERESFGARTVVTISSDGHVSPDDVLRSAVPDFFADPPVVSNIRLDNLFRSEPLKTLLSDIDRLPSDCNDCLWSDICRGGDQAIHRYRSDNGFDNKSVYCIDMDIMLSRMARFSVDSKLVDRDRMLENLGVA